MRLRTRTFLLCFVPAALLFSLSFWAIQQVVQSTVREGLRTSLRENHRTIARLRLQTDLQNSRFLRVVGENAPLKAGLQLLLSYRQSPAAIQSAAKQTLEDQLREMGEHMGFDFMMVSGPDGLALAGVLRSGRQLVPLDVTGMRVDEGRLRAVADRVLQVASVSVDQGEENIGSLTIGEYFDFTDFSTPAVLLRDGRVLRSTIPGAQLRDIAAALAHCAPSAECEIRLGTAVWMSLPMQNASLGGGYQVRGLQNVDAAAAPLRAMLQRVFLIASTGVVLLAVLGSLASARSIVRPIASVVTLLRRAENTGALPEFTPSGTGIREIRDLMEAFNRAAISVREARGNLQNAYVEFVGSLANALDARDRYTAGHSQRVSDLSRMTAVALGMSPGDADRIEFGALLHDIGKIGIADSVLQKPGRLTEEEYGLVKLHPEIGRRILEGVHGFAPYLPSVELHHENWDGTGYPHGQARKQTPVDARIIHIADAYDAMTSDRPYRRGLGREEALRIIHANAGTQFDPDIAAVFIGLPRFDSPAALTLSESVLTEKPC